MEGEQRSEVHILCITFPSQGHINPILQFSKRLASKGLRVTLITTNSSSTKFTQTLPSSINIAQISDGFEEGERAATLDEFFERYQVSVSQGLAQLIEKLSSSKYPAKFLVYDAIMPWTMNIARQFGIDGAPFFPSNMAVCAIYYHAHQGTLKVPLEGSTISMPSMPVLGINDLPSFLHHSDSYPSVLNFILKAFSDVQEPNWIFVNTFDKLEDEIIKWMESQWPVKAIGPTIPSIYLDKRLEEDRDYGLSLFKPDTDACIDWLDSKGTGSVVYVSFGSLAALGEEQMEELAWGLKRSNSYFLWVVRESEEKKLPSKFIEETSEKGLVVSWSPQLQVLAHKSVGCFMTHCGWNSTLEALSLGVPMVAMPQWTDQTTNAKFVADVWEIGVRVKVNEKGIVTREEIKDCIREIMEGEKRNKIRKNSNKWKEFAKEAVDDSGSSDKNIEEFVKKLASS